MAKDTQASTSFLEGVAFVGSDELRGEEALDPIDDLNVILRQFRLTRISFARTCRADFLFQGTSY